MSERNNNSQNIENEADKPHNLNNFYFYFPNCWYREINADNDDKKKIIEKIDEILATKNEEERKKISDAVKKMQTAATLGLEASELYMANNKLEANIKENERKKIAQEAEQVLRPIYEELISAGFDPELLIQ